jgi:hypothetical protein
MVQLALEQLQRYRAATFRMRPDLRLSNKEEAVGFVNERGYVYFWPIKGVSFPSLWTAVVGERPVADAHDDPGHVTWGWKDETLGKGQWHYAKILRGRATMISLAALPYFYATSDNFGDPEDDYLQLYEDGLLSREAKGIFEALLNEGPLDTVNLRRAVHMTGKASKSPFERGLTALQRDFKILPVGVSQSGGWRYSFIYDCVHRVYPELLAQARPIGRRTAMNKLAELYFESMGAATAADLRKLLQWPQKDVERALQGLVDLGKIQGGYRLEGASGEYYAAAAFLQAPPSLFGPGPAAI